MPHAAENTLERMTQASGWWTWARGQLVLPRARRWYPGSVFGLVYLVIPLVSIASSGVDPWTATVTILLILLVAIGFVLLPPLVWDTSMRTTGLAIGGYFLLTCLLFPFLGIYGLWMWIYVTTVAGMTAQTRRMFVAVLAVVAILQLIVMLVTGTLAENWYTMLLTASIGIMMYAFAQQIQALVRLRAAQSEVARLAVVEERARFSRDMHDVLGHSLTVVTVKSELARRLVSIDPGRAEEEIADVERLTRAALADLRAAVAGYRGMDLSTELAVAQASLAAADIEAHLPENAEVAAPELREVFGWVLREGVTNVIRHSGARNCWVELTRTSLAVCDDGRGMPAQDGGPGSACAASASGLRGLGERADAAGAVLQVGASSHGGIRLSVEARR